MVNVEALSAHCQMARIPATTVSTYEYIHGASYALHSIIVVLQYSIITVRIRRLQHHLQVHTYVLINGTSSRSPAVRLFR